MIKGKAHANRKKIQDRPEGDLYHSPMSTIWSVEEFIKEEFKNLLILEPSCGNMALAKPLSNMGYDITTNDLLSDKASMNLDYVNDKTKDISIHKQVIGNPPFSIWDDFVLRAKEHCDKFMFIGRLNYFGTYGRGLKGLWKNLKWVLPFNRYIDYQTPYREDGLFHVGSMATAWFLWDMDWDKDYHMSKIVDVQKWAILGSFKNGKHCSANFNIEDNTMDFI